jgi:hypothetical protein
MEGSFVLSGVIKKKHAPLIMPAGRFVKQAEDRIIGGDFAFY